MFTYFRQQLCTFTLGLAICSLSACGDPTETNFIENEKAVDAMDRIDIAKGASDESGLYIIDAAAFTISLSGCTSGYSATLTAAKTKFNVYKNDRNCKARLLDFTRSGKKYTPVPGKDFVSLMTGETATFQSPGGADSLLVRIVNQLSSPIQSGDSINFNFLETKVADQSVNILTTKFGAIGKYTKSGDTALNFKVKKAQLLSIDTATGIGRMIFKLDCQVPINKPGNPNADCGGVRLRSITYVLVNDTVNGSPCPTDPKKCEVYFTSTNPLEVRSQDYVDAGVDGLVNGGFTTRTEPTVALTTPGKLNVTPNMLLIISNGNSYQWFNLDLQTSANVYLTTFNHAGNEVEANE